MKTKTWALPLLTLAGFAGPSYLGCGTALEDDWDRLTNPALATDGGGAGDGSSGDGSSSDGSTEGDADSGPSCAGDPTTMPGIVRDDCGVFVSAGAAPGGTGTMEKPFTTFAEAAAASPSRVFACAGTYTETAQVSFSGGVEVYGGFTGCSGTSWTWSAGAKAQIATVADKPGVVLGGGANRLENVSVTAPAATMPGGSSIAVVVNGGSLDMTNGALAAGDAQDGVAGASLAPDPTLDGATGPNGANACDSGTHSPGPIGATNTCPTGGSSTGGNGGDGGQIVSNTIQPATSGSDGSATPPATAVGANDGKGGTGEGQSGATQCVRGDDGAAGDPGTSGAGATGPGSIAASGYTGAAGQSGNGGLPGQGGGGGGGAEGGLSVVCSSDAGSISVPGASGGAGGTGGCGGNAGGAGQSGGSSIALLALDAKVTLTGVTLTAGKGGAGGQGGDGQSGGHGGNGGSKGTGTGSLNDACVGGGGGKGGIGGPGGGGQGGHSLGIALQGTTAPSGGTFTIDTTKNGKGGAGGTNNTTTKAGKGADGVAANCWNFMTDMACQ